MNNRKQLQRQLKYIYVIYILILIAGFVLTISSSAFQAGFAQGRESAAENLTSASDGEIIRSYALVTRDEKLIGYEIEGLSSTIQTESILTSLEVNTNDLPPHVAERLTPSTSARFIIPMITIMFSGLAIFILVAISINSIRKSVKNSAPISIDAIRYTRITGVLMILVCALETLYNYFSIQNAKIILEGTPFTASADSSIDFWLLFSGLMMILMAQVISIARDLGKEQEYTV